jgi:outer membrane protein OmpA-like peptidoglycan-associated protein
VELLAPVLFAFDSDRLEPIGVAMLHEVAHLLRRRTDIELLEIQGYSDSRGTAVYNKALSQRRAYKVHAWLVHHGIDSDRLRVAGEGETQFVETDQSEKAHQQNRRVVFRVIRLRAP